MRWNSFSEFLALGGYGFYVWTAFGVTALSMMWEVFVLWRRRGAAAKWISRPHMTRNLG